jgi:hypothetical protein
MVVVRKIHVHLNRLAGTCERPCGPFEHQTLQNIVRFREQTKERHHEESRYGKSVTVNSVLSKVS